MLCLGLRPARVCGRGDRVPPRKSLSASSQALPRKAIVTQIVHPAEGRAPHARNYGTMPTPTLPPPGHRLIGDPSGWDGIRWPAYGLATRARRPRPSEKATLPVIPGFSPLGHASWARLPRRGGLRTPARNARAWPGHVSFWPQGLHLPTIIMLCLGLLPARICGRTECVPPRKSLSASSQALPRKAIVTQIVHPAESMGSHVLLALVASLTKGPPPGASLILPGAMGCCQA